MAMMAYAVLGRGILSAKVPKVEELAPNDIRAALPRFESAKPAATLGAGCNRAPEERYARPALDCLANGQGLSYGSLHCTHTRFEIAQTPRKECSRCGDCAHDRRSRGNRSHRTARRRGRNPLSDRTNAPSEPVSVESLS